MANIPDFFGLNLGHNSLKFTEIKPIGGNKANLLALGSTPTSFGLLDNDSQKGQEDLAREISKAYKESGIRTKNCVMSIPESIVFSRLITLPKLNANELDESIQYAMKPLISVNIEDVNISYLQIDQKVLQGSTFSNWYVVAAPKRQILRYQNTITKAGLNLLAVETEALALTRMVSFNYPDQKGNDLLIIDIGAESSNIVLGRNGVVIFSQTLSVGSDAITKVISADFGIDIIQAEKYKVTYGLNLNDNGGKIAQSIEPLIQIMVGELQRTVAYYQEKIGGNGISSIMLTGGGADLPSLDTYLNSKLNLPVIKVNPINRMQINGQITKELSSLHIQGFNVALGLALKGYFD